MKVAIVQHRLRGEVDADIEALVSAIETACSRGAEMVVCPLVPTIAEHADEARSRILGRIQRCPEGTALLIPFRGPEGSSGPTVVTTPLGTTALLIGDQSIAPHHTDELVARPPDAVVMRPLAESELQAEAILEHALALSLSVSGVVAVAECAGAGFAEPGHGGSALIVLGEVIAEAIGDDDVILADFALPIQPPEPRESLPTLPPILEQRLAHHEGRKPDLGYLADLS